MKAVIYDADGMLLHGTRFSDRYEQEFGIPAESMSPFFTGPFEKCVIGEADVKEELVKGGWLQKWNWKGTVEELLEYWHHSGDDIDDRILASVADLRAKGILCILTTNQEKYRAAYLRNSLGLADRFDTVLTSGEIGYKKPHPKFLEKTMEYLRSKDPSIQKSDVLFWDDRETYATGAREFGLDSHVFKDFDDYQKTMNSYLH